MQQMLDLFKKKKFLYTFAFLLPFAIYSVIFMLLGVAPFGEIRNMYNFTHICMMFLKTEKVYFIVGKVEWDLTLLVYSPII